MTVNECVDKMVGIFEDLEKEKDHAKDACTDFYTLLEKSVKIGDDDLPSQKMLEKIAAAVAKDKLDKLKEEALALQDALRQTRNAPTLFKG